MKSVKLIAFDIDGTLTSGSIVLDAEGGEQKQFSVADGLGFRLADSIGIHLAVISARSSKAVKTRMAWLPPENVLLKVGDKAVALRELQNRLGASVDETAFMGDDFNDLPAFEYAGIKIATANAARQVKRLANYITTKPGGDGAAREAIEWLLRGQNRLEEAIEKYLERELSNV